MLGAACAHAPSTPPCRSALARPRVTRRRLTSEPHLCAGALSASVAGAAQVQVTRAPTSLAPARRARRRYKKHQLDAAARAAEQAALGERLRGALLRQQAGELAGSQARPAWHPGRPALAPRACAVHPRCPRQRLQQQLISAALGSRRAGAPRADGVLCRARRRGGRWRARTRPRASRLRRCCSARPRATAAARPPMRSPAR